MNLFYWSGLQCNRITGHLQVSDFRFKFKVLFRSMCCCSHRQYTWNKMDGVVFFRCHFLDLSPSSVLRPCLWLFLSQKIVTMNSVTLFTQHNGVFQAFSSRQIAVCKRMKEDYEINGIRCRTVKFSAGKLLKNSPRSKAGQLSRYDFNFYPFNCSVCPCSSENKTKKSKFVRLLSHSVSLQLLPNNGFLQNCCDCISSHVRDPRSITE